MVSVGFLSSLNSFVGMAVLQNHVISWERKREHLSVERAYFEHFQLFFFFLSCCNCHCISTLIFQNHFHIRYGCSCLPKNSNIVSWR